MKSSQNLFYLVKSLSKAEKRYFTINVLQQSENKNYAKLFNEIERQVHLGKYEEAVIKEKFKSEKFTKQLTFTKNYLYNSIVKSLINFYSGENIEAKIYNLILSAKILFKKTFFDDYFRNLETAKILAEKSERFGILLDIIKIQMTLVRLKDLKKNKDRNLYDEEKNIIKKIENISLFSKLLNAFYKITKIPDYARSKILYNEAVKIFESPLLNTEKNALSVTAKDKYYQLLIHKTGFLGNTNKLFNLSVKRYELYKNNKQVFKPDAENKEMHLLYSSLYFAILNGKNLYYKKYLKLFEEKFVHIKTNVNDSMDISTNYCFLQLHFCYNNNNLPQAIIFAEKIFNRMRNNESVQNKDELLSYYFLYAKMLFENKNYLKTLDVINVILKHEYKAIRYDILSYSYFLEIFTHYELKNYQLVQSYVLGLTRKLSKHKEKDLSEKIMLKFFNELCSETKIDEKFVLKKYYKKFQLLKKSKYEKAFFSEFPIDEWILKKFS